MAIVAVRGTRYVLAPFSETREWEAIMKVVLFQASEGASGHEPALGVQPKVVFRPRPPLL